MEASTPKNWGATYIGHGLRLVPMLPHSKTPFRAGRKRSIKLRALDESSVGTDGTVGKQSKGESKEALDDTDNPDATDGKNPYLHGQ